MTSFDIFEGNQEFKCFISEGQFAALKKIYTELNNKSSSEPNQNDLQTILKSRNLMEKYLCLKIVLKQYKIMQLIWTK